MLAPCLRHRIDFERMVKTRNTSTGAMTESWVPLASKEPAEITPLSGSELLAATADQSKATDRIVVRKGVAFTTKDRIVHDGTPYNIVAAIPDPTLRRHVTVLAERGVRNG